MDKSLKKIIIPGWAVQPEACSAMGTGNSFVYDFDFFHGTGAGAVINFNKNMMMLCASPCILHAHSLGAMLALGCLDQLGSAKALVIWSGFAKFAKDDGNDHGQDPGAIESMEKQLLQNPSGLVKSFYRTMYSPGKYNGRIPDVFNIPALAAGLDCLLKCDFRKKLAEIRTPVLILHGNEDRIADVELASVLSGSLESSSLKIFNGAGHALPFTHPDEAGLVVDKFLRVHDVI
ncbi:MAG: hypothetical protein A2X48_20390 [Lentisphaerae bacterium GWF2_49_21]|nr:MAG: hypothetical protein A2X48_20390 [Lentisphaerae bacterium GWF2_49_21]